METANEKLLKLAHETRKSNNKKLTRIGQKASNSGGSPHTVVNLDQETAGTETRRGKRHHEGSVDVVLEENQERGFVMPLCFSKSNYFVRFPLSVSPTDTQTIEQMDPSTRVKQLVDDNTSMIQVLEMAQVLARGGTVSATDLKKAQDTQKVVDDKLWKVEVALRVSKDKLKKKTEEPEKKVGEWRKENEKLVENLRAEWKASYEEPEDVKGLETRAELVEKIEALQLDCFEMGRAGFEIAVDQLKVLNLGFLTKGIGLRSKIDDGQLIPGSL